VARIDSLANFLEDVATKIRSKTGSQSTITPANYDTEIEKIVFKPGKGFLFCTDGSPMNPSDTTTTSLNLKNIDTSDMKSLLGMFRGMKALTSLDLSDFDTHNVTNMQYMFRSCEALTNITFGDDFSTENVQNMSIMFQNCYALTSLDLSNWGSNKNISLDSTFQSCYALTNITFGDDFNTNYTTNMTSVFGYCKSLEELDLSNWNTNIVTKFNASFRDCIKLTSITFGNNFSLSSATNLQNMFTNSTKLDNNTLNQILYLCTTATSYTGTKTLAYLGIDSSFDNYANIPNLSNYQAFLNAGWTIS